MAIDINNNSTQPTTTPLKAILRILFIIFGGMGGLLFTIICVVAIFDNIIFSNDYIEYDGVIIDAKPVESYISVTYRSKRSTTGKKITVEDRHTCYRQDITVSYNNTTVELTDVSTDIEGYTINENVSVYVNKNNSEKITIHYDVSDKTHIYKFIAYISIYWCIYLCIAIIPTIKKRKNKHD